MPSVILHGELVGTSQPQPKMIPSTGSVASSVIRLLGGQVVGWSEVGGPVRWIRICGRCVRTKLTINMGTREESQVFRLAKEERTGPGATASSQEFPWKAVVG